MILFLLFEVMETFFKMANKMLKFCSYKKDIVNDFIHDELLGITAKSFSNFNFENKKVLDERTYKQTRQTNKQESKYTNRQTYYILMLV
jgi:hypothetical protein